MLDGTKELLGINEFNYVFNEDINSGITIVNFDPKNMGEGVYKNAIVAVVGCTRGKSLKSEWVQFDCNGINKRFVLKWFDNGTCQNLNSYVGKLITCDIVSNRYGYAADTEPIIVEGAKDEQADGAIEYIRREFSQDTYANDIMTLVDYFGIMTKSNAMTRLIRLALEIKFMNELSKMFPTAKLDIAKEALLFRSMTSVVKEGDFDPDFVVYANIYKPHWKGNADVAKYFIVSSQHMDITRHLINTVTSLVDNLMVGGSIV